MAGVQGLDQSRKNDEPETQSRNSVTTRDITDNRGTYCLHFIEYAGRNGRELFAAPIHVCRYVKTFFSGKEREPSSRKASPSL